MRFERDLSRKTKYHRANSPTYAEADVVGRFRFSAEGDRQRQHEACQMRERERHGYSPGQWRTTYPSLSVGCTCQREAYTPLRPAVS